MADSKDAGIGDLHTGVRIGRYEIVRRLSLGGMAELFLAVMRARGGFQKYVVIKRILPDAREDEHFLKMFLDEARITASLNHPNIAQVFELDEDAEGPYLAMEYVAGLNLNEILAACERRRAVLPYGFAAGVVHEVCVALQYAHTFVDPQGNPSPVIHRDVAPKNVMVGFDGVVKLLDFGIAKSRRSLGRTKAGTVKGTTGYMSPEQVKGARLDGRSDVFSVGVMLHELLTGRRLFTASSEMEEMRAILEHEVPPPVAISADIPKALSDVAMRALARQPADRFGSARELAKAIEASAQRFWFDADARAAFLRELAPEGSPVDSKPSARTDPSLLRAEVGSLADPASDRLLELQVQAQSLASPPPRTRLLPVGALAATAALALLAYTAPSLQWVTAWLRPTPSLKPYAPPKGLPEFGAPRFPSTPEDVDVVGVLPAQKRATAARTGTLTLVTTPECDVVLGRERLGRTPLFKVKLPAGTHPLRLVPESGRPRALTVPIAPGENTALRIGLGDLPTL